MSLAETNWPAVTSAAVVEQRAERRRRRHLDSQEAVRRVSFGSVKPKSDALQDVVVALQRGHRPGRADRAVIGGRARTEDVERDRRGVALSTPPLAVRRRPAPGS